MINKKKLIIFISLISILLIGVGTYWLNFSPENSKYQNNKRKHSACLKDDEIVDYSALGKNQKQQEVNKGYFATSPVTIFIKDRESGEEKYSFQIDNNSRGFFTLQLFQCNIYVTRIFNFDEQRGLPLSNYRTELWRYSYNGTGEKLLILFKKEGAPDNYGQSFRISPNEKYVIFEQSYLSKENYGLVIKDLNTKEDIFILLSRDLQKTTPNFIGVFDMVKWSDDGKYFWGSVSDGAYVLAYFRIDTQNWRANIFEAPEGAMGGFPLNINAGYVPVQPGQVWTGDYQLTQELKEQYRKEGKSSSLYLYNLFTKEKILVETIDEPLFSFKLRWLSGTELEYYLPSGERKVYKIDEK